MDTVISAVNRTYPKGMRKKLKLLLIMKRAGNMHDYAG